jgi:hypothetical protein
MVVLVAGEGQRVGVDRSAGVVSGRDQVGGVS